VGKLRWCGVGWDGVGWEVKGRERKGWMGGKGDRCRGFDSDQLNCAFSCFLFSYFLFSFFLFLSFPLFIFSLFHLSSYHICIFADLHICIFQKKAVPMNSMHSVMKMDDRTEGDIK
jgi:hypothetical protein